VPSARERRRGPRGTGVLVVVAVLTTSGCGFLDAVAHPETAAVSAGSSADGTRAPAPPTVRYPVPLIEAAVTGAGTLTVSVDQAVTPATPQGRDDVLASLQVRVSDLRLRSGSGAEQPLAVGAVTRGAVCADDPDALCVPLGPAVSR
jgi:hypothetical protein